MNVGERVMKIPKNDLSYIEYAEMKQFIMDKIEADDIELNEMFVLVSLLAYRLEKIKHIEEKLYGENSNTETRGSNNTCDC